MADKNAPSLIFDRSWLAAASLLGLVTAIYWPVAGYDFVNWDDPWYVLNNPLIKSWHPANLWRIATEMSVKNFAPLTIFSLLVDHTLFGLNAGGYHIVNVLLHAANTLLVCLLVSRLSGHRSAGIITAALFAVHPVQIETVAWVSSRKTLLCSLFMLGSGLCWLRTDRTGRHEFWGTVLLALALLSKAAAIIVPAMVIAYDLLIARRKLSEAVSRQIIPGFLCVLLLSITMSAQNLYMGGLRGHMELSKPHLLAVDSVIVWKYVGMLFAPSNLSLLYDPPTSGIAVSVAWSLLGWAAVFGMCWRWRHSRPGVAFAVVCWFCLLAPVLNLYPITTLMNDRYLYLPCICLFALVATAGVRLIAISRNLAAGETVRANCRRQFAINSAAAVMVAGIVCGYARLSTQRLPDWKDNYTLWQKTVGQMPQLAVVQIQWADALHEAGQEAAARAALHLALTRCNPDAGDRERIHRRLSDWRYTPEPPRTSFVSLELPETSCVEGNN
jgi:protein O-mannosyl-transferase